MEVELIQFKVDDATYTADVDGFIKCKESYNIHDDLIRTEFIDGFHAKMSQLEVYEAFTKEMRKIKLKRYYGN